MSPRSRRSLQAHGRLSLDLLERYGRDLLDIVAFLDGQGVTHRDIKPANLAARPRPKDKQPHLCIFDFSLAAAPAEQIGAGTPQYLDPFLGPPRRPRFDLAAERFAAAVTLYEMATGTLPRWGDGIANPATIADEVTISPELFDPAVADRLGAFFARALARDARGRGSTPSRRWPTRGGSSSRTSPLPRPPNPPRRPRRRSVTRDTPIDLVGLTARARSALERFGVRTVGELVDYDAFALYRLEGVPQATKTEIRAGPRSCGCTSRPQPAEEEAPRGAGPGPGHRQPGRAAGAQGDSRATAPKSPRYGSLLGLAPPAGSTTLPALAHPERGGAGRPGSRSRRSAGLLQRQVAAVGARPTTSPTYATRSSRCSTRTAG